MERAIFAMLVLDIEECVRFMRIDAAEKVVVRKQLRRS